MSRILKWIVLRFKQIPAYLLWMVWTVMAASAFLSVEILFVGSGSDYGTRSLFGDLITHWPLAVLFVVVGLMLAGHLARGWACRPCFGTTPTGRGGSGGPVRSAAVSVWPCSHRWSGP